MTTQNKTHILNRSIYYSILLVFYALTGGVFYLALTEKYIPIEGYHALHIFMLILLLPIILKYILILTVAPFYGIIEKMRSKNRPDTYQPSVTILIPAWNEEIGILTTLKSIINTYPNLEVIVVNDGSTDKTHEIVNDYINIHQNTNSDTMIRYYRVENGGKAKALNRVLPLVSGEIVITIDADSSVDKNTVRNMVKHFWDKKVASVAGNVVIGNKKTFLGVMQQIEYLFGFYFKKVDSVFNAVYIVGGAAAAYRTEIIKGLGNFDENIITEDIELSTRIQDEGYHIRYAADATVYTEGPSETEGLFKQRLRWKYGRFMTFIKYKHLFFSTKPKHNKYLTFLILPTALFAEIMLFFEGFLFTILGLYIFFSHDYMSLIISITVVTMLVLAQIITDPIARYHRNLIIFAPIAWITFYIMDAVEYQALIRSLKRIIMKQDLAWQKWKRTGVFDNSLIEK